VAVLGELGNRSARRAGSNFERYKNPATDALINQFAQTNRSGDRRKQIISKLELVMLKEVPVIPRHGVRRLVPVRHQQVHGLADPVQPIRAAGGVQLPRLGAGDDEPDPDQSSGAARARPIWPAGKLRSSPPARPAHQPPAAASRKRGRRDEDWTRRKGHEIRASPPGLFSAR